MKIRKLRASFGKLQNDTLTLHDGLNIVYAPNESGKSTWCAFIRAMLYGVDSSERARAGSLPDKQRYAPWSGAPMEGTMDVRAEGFDMTLTRSTAARTRPMQVFSAVYTGTNTPVEGMTAGNAGELLTGVNREVFTRSAFIAQGRVAVTGNPELEKRIQSIVTSGDEEVSGSEAGARLKTWQRRRRWHRKGMLPELEGRMDEAQRLLNEMDSGVTDIQALEQKLEETQAQCETLEAAVTDARRRQRAGALERLRQGRALVQERSDVHDDALAALSQARDNLRNSDFGDRTSERLEAEIREDRERLEELEELPGPGRSLVFAVLFGLLALAAAAVYGVTAKLWLVFLAGALCVGAVICFMRYSRLRQQLREMLTERNRILRKYRISVPEDMDAILKRHRALEAAVKKAEQEEKRSREVLARAGLQLRTLEDQAVGDLDFTGGDSEAARLSRALQQKRREASELSGRISNLNGRLSAMGDAMVLGSELQRMQELHDTVQEEYEAITLAEELLREADQEIRNRFSPELSKLAAEYMREMTGGRYEELLIGQDFSARARAGDDAVSHEAEYLSAGTLDLLYLAVRLAVCELALPDGEPCPLILDDALVNLDDARLQQAMKLLRKLALKRQVILFTCRNTEAQEKPTS